MTEELDISLRDIKKEFYRYRNGAIAEKLKQLYPNKTVFGLIVPQLMEIAGRYPKNINLATALWNDNNCREARLLALYLLPLDDVSKDIAIKMIREVENTEEAEFLAFKVLRNLNFAKDLLTELSALHLNNKNEEHCIKMLGKNLGLNIS